MCHSALLRWLAEAEAQAGAQDHVVALSAGGRVAKVNIVERKLPTEPFRDVRDGVRIKGEAVFAAVRDVREDFEALVELRARIDGVRPGFAGHDLASLLAEGVVVRVVERGAAVDVEGSIFRSDGVIAEAAGENVAQIELLELVVVEIRESVDEEIFRDVEVHANVAADV